MKIPRPKLNVIELAMWAALVMGLAYMVGVARTEHRLKPYLTLDSLEAQFLGRLYGPTRNSAHVEEWILKDYFKDRRGGVFVEVGANHHQHDSNTYYLETVMGWSGLAIEPQLKFAAGYRQYRPRTIFVPLFISDASNRHSTLYIGSNDQMASGFREFTGPGLIAETTTETSTLDDVLDRLQIKTIDFLSIDIELAEPQALAGFSIGRFTPTLVAIEAHRPVRQQILDYFTRHQYALVGRYWRADSHNFWFAPLGTVPDEPLTVANHTH